MGSFPHLLLQPLFWQLWLMQTQRFIRLTALAVALPGIRVVHDYRRTLLFAYLCYGATKTYYIYILPTPIAPVAALSLGPSLALITRRLAKFRSDTLNRLATAAAAVALFSILPIYYLQDRPDRSRFAKEFAIAGTIGKSFITAQT
jgi:hypothetical protein